MLRSLALKFDLYNNAGEGTDSTGIFTNGRSPTIRQPGLAPGYPDASIDMTGTGIDLHSGDPFTVNLTYDGTTLTETITDTVTHATFTTSYAVNIPALVGSDVAYVGFTGGTGGLTAVQDILAWTFQTSLPRQRTGNLQPQLAAGGPAPSDSGFPPLTEAELAPVAQEAVAIWAATGLSAAQVDSLNAVQYHIGTLGGGVLGLTGLGAQVVSLDATADGYGWFLDSMPGDDSAFGNVVAPFELQASLGSPAFGRMDLLTVVEHELGHVLGLSDLDPQSVPHDLMTETLATGVRRLPTTSIANVIEPGLESTDMQALASAGGNNQLAAVPTMDAALAILLAQLDIKGVNQATNSSAVYSPPLPDSSNDSFKNGNTLLWSPYQLKPPIKEVDTEW